MHLLSALLIIGIIIVALFIATKRISLSPDETREHSDNTPKYKANSFLTPAERSFFGVLQQAIASDYLIFAKVRLADIVHPVKNPSRSGWQSAFNRITGKHVDFVLCDVAHVGVVAVIELDDNTHTRFEHGIRDSLKDAALADAAIPILRIPAKLNYSPAKIREQVQNIFVKRQQSAN